MKRPMCVIGGTLSLSTWAAFFFDSGESLLLSAALLLTGLAVLAWTRLRGPLRYGRALCTACAVAALAFGLHSLREARLLEPFEGAAGEVVTAEGMVEEVSTGSRAIRYRMKAAFPERPDLPEAWVLLRSYGEMDYLPGDVIRCEALLTPQEQPETGLRHGPETFLEGRLTGSSERLEGSGGGHFLLRGLLSLRDWLRRNVYANLHGASADVVSAMVLGMQDNVSAETYSAVNRAGTSHLLSVSGLHLSILTALLLSLLTRAGVPERARIGLVILASLGFAVLVGFSASITRALVMSSVALAAGLAGRRGDPLSALGFAAALICLVWPHWLLGKGFWLSAGATLGILLYAGRLQAFFTKRLTGGSGGALAARFGRYASAAMSVSVAASVFTLPLLTVFNGWVSLISPLANLLVAPFVPGTIFGGIACALFRGNSLPLRLVALLTDLCTALILQISRMMAGLPFAILSLDEGWMVFWLVLAAGLAVALYLSRGGVKLAVYGLTLLALAFGAGSLSAAAGNRNAAELVTIADCDTAVLLKDGEAVILGTPAYYEANRLIRYLEYRGVERIRAVVAHDCGEQISSGLLRLAERYPVDCVLGPDDAYILGQLATVLPESPVYSGGYATMNVWGGLGIQVSVPEGNALVLAENNTVLKSAEEYGIMKDKPDKAKYSIRIHPGGEIALEGATGYEPAPLGAAIYGERRFRLRLV